jgi:hypothetical protein
MITRATFSKITEPISEMTYLNDPVNSLRIAVMQVLADRLQLRSSIWRWSN